MHLTTVWFLLIAILWTGYFVLEGFDFGVGILLPVLAKDDIDRRLVINTIGPTWDGNEVWLIVAGGAMFAAFPEWYASLFSGFYLALFAILVALIVRGLAFEYRSKIDEPRWRQRWDRVLFWGSAVPAVLWGVAFANIVRGVPLDASHHYTGSFFTLLNPYALLGGLVTLGLFTLHGAVFLALRTNGDIRLRARSIATRLAVPVVGVSAAFLVITQAEHGKAWTDLTAVVAALALVGAVLANRAGREVWAFVATAATVVAAVATLFGDLWPNVLPSSTAVTNSLTVRNAASSAYTLGVMSWVALVFTPLVLGYQTWTYWVFRKRLSRDDIRPVGLAPAVASKP